MSTVNKKKRKLPPWMTGKTQHAEADLLEGSGNQDLPGNWQNETKIPRAECGPHGLVLPYLKFDGSTTYSHHRDDCNIICDEILSSLGEDDELTVGFDIEWTVTYRLGESPKTSMLQLCTSHTQCYLFHLSNMIGFPVRLKTLLQDHRIKKVGVGIESDLWRLDKDYDVKARAIIAQSMVDLSRLANKVLKSRENWSLDGLCQNVVHYQLDKDPSIRKGDWTRFPLLEKQKSYAATDAYASLLIFEELQKRSIPS